MRVEKIYEPRVRLDRGSMSARCHLDGLRPLSAVGWLVPFVSPTAASGRVHGTMIGGRSEGRAVVCCGVSRNVSGAPSRRGSKETIRAATKLRHFFPGDKK